MMCFSISVEIITLFLLFRKHCQFGPRYEPSVGPLQQESGLVISDYTCRDRDK